ncbi:hypothetical protein F4678DRAFT_483980 [Xylaria arbuscula]|nr:hypothetical protein F4678DRAFT_483980 [Xylaria arbuscula]
MTSRARRCRRYDSGPDDHETLQRPSSLAHDNPDTAAATVTILLSPPAATPLHMTDLVIPLSITLCDRPLPPDKTSMNSRKKKKRGNTPPPEMHQPIGFVCCYCQYHSSGSYCSNPDRADCPHKTIPRCRDCPIIFTNRQMRHGIYEDG